MIVVVNKMDSCGWSKDRFESITKDISDYLIDIGFGKKVLYFVPISSSLGLNITESISLSHGQLCPWYTGHCLFGVFNSMKKIKRNPKSPLCVPVFTTYNEDGGLTAVGKVESGTVSVGDTVTILPSHQTATVTHLLIDDVSVHHALCGEIVSICFDFTTITSSSDSEYLMERKLTSGCVICSHDAPCFVAKKFKAQVYVCDLPNHTILTIGYCAMLHIHNVVVECEVLKIPHKIHPTTHQISKAPPKWLKSKDLAVVDFEIKANPIPLGVSFQSSFILYM
ncbi:hypothetical protein RFI_02555 [Reticulomyxa filosa]|uniref:GTP-eEF1A C-terminal domain-containing protein n=1 Tax=Reticulomyxa filosa TaxID=46433 RepID=X6P902_RETFI|nr:hypothetical protein RFI_02555 [Reticulomyxa filosa]|eukprot:ETO34539.1 hypothetical protein RFI_02555 [Reticulomyxa filosa]